MWAKLQVHTTHLTGIVPILTIKQECHEYEQTINMIRHFGSITMTIPIDRGPCTQSLTEMKITAYYRLLRTYHPPSTNSVREDT